MSNEYFAPPRDYQPELRRIADALERLADHFAATFPQERYLCLCCKTEYEYPRHTACPKCKGEAHCAMPVPR